MKEAILQGFRLLVAVTVPLAACAAGLRAPKSDALWLWRQPSLLLRSLLAILVVVPVGVTLALSLLGLPSSVKGGIFVAELAIGIGPITAFQRMHGAQPCYEIGLSRTLLLVSIPFVPAAVAIYGAVSGQRVPLGPGQVARVVVSRALVPLLLGIMLGRIWPRLAKRFGRWA